MCCMPCCSPDGTDRPISERALRQQSLDLFCDAQEIARALRLMVGRAAYDCRHARTLEQSDYDARGAFLEAEAWMLDAARHEKNGNEDDERYARFMVMTYAMDAQSIINDAEDLRHDACPASCNLKA